LVATLITGFARLLTGARARWMGCAPEARQRIYFANHRSHADFVLLWASLPPRLRETTRPVAGADYWREGALRRFLIHQVFRGVLIDRNRETRTEDPIAQIVAALGSGASLIVFPEGTRNLTDEPLLPLKSGLYYTALRRPDVELVPVWIDNLGRVLPKGMLLPVPLLCTVNFGEPLALAAAESKDDFLERARRALLELNEKVRPR
jgi:1-acyl-sn-glycerol-3-phosphate acyltransferase